MGMTRLRRLLKSRMERGVVDFQMVQPGDRIAVGVSGGPDSLSLLNLFLDGFGHVSNDFSILAVHVDMGFDQPDPKNAQVLESHFRALRVDYRIVHTGIAGEILSPSARKSPCFLCSLLRRKRVYGVAAEEACNKIAYGHHQDDIIETLLINILYGRKVGTMYPVQPIFKNRLTLIRPFVYIQESLLKRFALESRLPDLPRLCPMDGSTRRQNVKEIISRLQHDERAADIRNNIFKSLYHVELESFDTISKPSDFA
jgi:tRNA 2-thiocytidine biosynthesis protein TtcA